MAKTQYPEGNWRNDPMVAEALKERKPRDIMLFECRCGATSYYNQGSHATCHLCGAGYYMATEDELDDPELSERGAVLMIEECTFTLEDRMDAEAEDPVLP